MTKQEPIAAATMSSALVKALADIGGAAKDKLNPHFKAKYADLSSVTEAIKPALARYGLGFTQANEPSEGGVIVETLLWHDGTDEPRSLGKLFVPANKNDAQGFGSALTYARRYALMTAFGVPAEDDDGNAAVKTVDKVPGIHKIKERLRGLMQDGAKAETLDDFNALVSQHKADLTTIKDAGHEWWTGDGEDFEGFKSLIQRRRAELQPSEESLQYQLLVSTLNECETGPQLKAWLAQHGDVVGALDGEQSRAIETLYDEKEAALKLLDTATAGA